jgi:hypothetical protein
MELLSGIRERSSTPTPALQSPLTKA